MSMPPSPKRWRRAAPFVATLCGACAGPPAPAASGPTTAPPAPRQTCPSFASKGSAAPASWQPAADGDVLELARLADREGALALVAGAARGGNAGRVALAALPYAPDAPLALEQMCGWLASCVEPHETLLLTSLHELLVRHPVEDAERLDVAGARRCEQVLSAGARGQRSPHARDLADSVLALVRERLRLPAPP